MLWKSNPDFSELLPQSPFRSERTELQNLNTFTSYRLLLLPKYGVTGAGSHCQCVSVNGYALPMITVKMYYNDIGILEGDFFDRFS